MRINVKASVMSLAMVLVILPSAAHAGFYKLIKAGVSTSVAKSSLTVVPTRNWNRFKISTGKQAEAWTLDGLSLNELSFYGGIANDKTLFREVAKKKTPLPRFNATMLAPDVANLLEQSYRIALDTPMFEIKTIEPSTFAGKFGFRFTYTYTLPSDSVVRKGEAVGAIVDGKLYMISFAAPSIYYYDRDVETFRGLAASAKLVPIAMKR